MARKTNVRPSKLLLRALIKYSVPLGVAYYYAFSRLRELLLNWYSSELSLIISLIVALLIFSVLLFLFEQYTVFRTIIFYSVFFILLIPWLVVSIAGVYTILYPIEEVGRVFSLLLFVLFGTLSVLLIRYRTKLQTIVVDEE